MLCQHIMYENRLGCVPLSVVKQEGHSFFMKNKRNTLKKYPDFFGNYEYSAYLCKI